MQNRTLLTIAILAGVALSAEARFVVINYDPHLDWFRGDFVGWVRSAGPVAVESLANGNQVVRMEVVSSLGSSENVDSFDLEHLDLDTAEREARKQHETTGDEVVLGFEWYSEFPAGSEWFMVVPRLDNGRYWALEGFAFPVENGAFARDLPVSYREALDLEPRPNIEAFITAIRKRIPFFRMTIERSPASPETPGSDTGRQSAAQALVAMLRAAAEGRDQDATAYVAAGAEFDIPQLRRDCFGGVDPSAFRISVRAQAIIDDHAALIAEGSGWACAEDPFPILFIREHRRWQALSDGYAFQPSALDHPRLDDNTARTLSTWIQQEMLKLRQQP